MHHKGCDVHKIKMLWNSILSFWQTFNERVPHFFVEPELKWIFFCCTFFVARFLVDKIYCTLMGDFKHLSGNFWILNLSPFVFYECEIVELTTEPTKKKKSDKILYNLKVIWLLNLSTSVRIYNKFLRSAFWIHSWKWCQIIIIYVTGMIAIKIQSTILVRAVAWYIYHQLIMTCALVC